MEINKVYDWARIRRLLKLGLIGAIVAVMADFILGWGVYDESADEIERFFSLYADVSDGRLAASALLGMLGMTAEELALFSVYSLIKNNSEKLAGIYRAGIIGCSIFGICGFHVGCVAMFFCYNRLSGFSEKYILQYATYFVAPSVIIFFIFFLALSISQIIAFAKGCTPYPKWCWMFSALIMAYIVYVASELIGNYPLTNAVSTAWLHLGFLWMYAGLLILSNKTESRKKEFN